MRIDYRLLIGLILGCFLASGVAIAKKRGGGGGLLNPKRMERIANRLGVDDSTMEKMRSLVYAAKRKGVTLRASIEQARIDLHELMQQGEPDRATIMKKVEAIGRIRTEARKLRVGAMLDIRALLNPEQRKKLHTIMEKRRRHRAGNKRRGKGRKHHRRNRSDPMED